jgi:hypothetical protein
MRRMLPILFSAALAASLAIPAVSRAQQADPAASGSQASGTATAPAPAPQQDSLAEAARRAREAKKEQPKPAKVFDNDNLPGGTISTVGKTDEAKKDGDDSADANADDKKPSSNAEKDWKEKFSNLRAKLAHDQDDLQVMQRELGVLNLQNYSDPVKGMQQGVTRSDINDKVAAIDAKQKAIAADQQAISDAEDALRKAGGDSGWAR